MQGCLNYVRMVCLQGVTHPPPKLSERDLIAAMERHGIGTDATVADHIQKQLDRGYAAKDAAALFSPSPLGEALIAGYHKMGLSNLWQPDLRWEATQRLPPQLSSPDFMAAADLESAGVSDSGRAVAGGKMGSAFKARGAREREMGALRSVMQRCGIIEHSVLEDAAVSDSLMQRCGIIEHNISEVAVPSCSVYTAQWHHQARHLRDCSALMRGLRRAGASSSIASQRMQWASCHVCATQGHHRARHLGVRGSVTQHVHTVASSNTTAQRLWWIYGVSVRRRGIIEHSISEVAAMSCSVCGAQGHHRAQHLRGRTALMPCLRRAGASSSTTSRRSRAGGAPRRLCWRRPCSTSGATTAPPRSSQVRVCRPPAPLPPSWTVSQ